MKIRDTIQKYRECVRNYKFHSLFLKNLSLLLVLILVPFTAAAGLGYYAFSNVQRGNLQSTNQRLATEIFGDWKRILKEAEMELSYIGFNSNVQLFFYDNVQLEQLNYSLRSIQELIRMPIIAKNYVNGVYVYAEKSGKVIFIDGITNYDTFQGRACIEECQKSSSGVLITENRESGNGEQQISVCREIHYGTENGGWLVMNLNLEEIAKEIKVPDPLHIYLINGEDILFDSENEATGKKVDECLELSNREVNNTILTRQSSICYIKSENNGLEVVSFLGTEWVNEQLSTVGVFILIFLLLLLVLTLGLTTIISFRIFQPIGEILHYIEKYQITLVGEERMLQDKNELEYIIHSIQKTVTVKRDVDRELAERVRLLKKAQAVALQAQINPHFINNTLDTINWTAIGLLGGRNEISEMIDALSKMMRAALNDTDTIISIDKEREHCWNYLLLQKKRYEDKFDVTWDIPEELYGYKTIRLILQPIVENAISHGLKPLSNKGHLRISGYVKEGYVHLEVEDNGLGMTQEELEKLKANLSKSTIRETRHIGISNVNQRLKLYFGEESGVFVESSEGVGTKVTLCFPKISV